MDTKAGTLCNLGGEDGERIVLGMKESGDRYEIMLLWEWSLNLCGRMDTAAVCPKDNGLCSLWSLDCNAPLLQGAVQRGYSSCVSKGQQPVLRVFSGR